MRPQLEYEYKVLACECELEDMIKGKGEDDKDTDVIREYMRRLLEESQPWAACDVYVTCRECRTGFEAVACTISQSFRDAADFEANAFPKLMEAARAELFECLELAQALQLDDGWTYAHTAKT